MKVGVGTAILVVGEDHKLLLMKRKGAHAANTFACPGGWIDFTDESPEDAAVRELKEELNLKVHKDELEQVRNVSEYHPELDVRTVTLYYKLFYSVAFNGIPKIGEPNKCSEIVWRYELDWMRAAREGELKLFPQLYEVLSKNLKNLR